ncbi:Cell division protein DivIC (FtsB), stabilizes FtsL against RasP cleavage [Salinisphaera sp. LB1]|nr:Cell division protein DivIC (FtsB), stabilizes FtsL against RasP cleavage [Salinisphaera sp. LB1]
MRDDVPDHETYAGQPAATRYNRAMYRVAVIALVVVLAGLQYRLWIGDGSLAQVHHLQTMHQKIVRENKNDRERNNAMQARINDLKSGVGATEGRARVEMGMVKPGETFFLTVPDESAPTKASHAASGKTASAG